MKQIILFIVFFVSIESSIAQKVFYFYNFSSHTVEIGGVVTKPDNGDPYPFFDSSVSPLITVLPGELYVLENTSNLFRFPFFSPASVPYIDTWYRVDSPSSSITIDSMPAWVLGNAQEFHYVKFQVGSSGSLGGGNLGVPGGSSQGDSVQSLGNWTALYSGFQSGNYIEYTCVIFDD